MISYVTASATHVGQVRSTNQDHCLITGTIVAVADGMGGHAGGETAAAIAIGELSGIRGVVSTDRLIRVVNVANQRIMKEGLEPSLRGMGTTLVAAALNPETAELGLINIGDSRAYRLRDRVLTQLTVDHSLVEDLVREGRLTPEEAQSHPQRNIVTRALGIGPDIEVDSFGEQVKVDDRYLLCSDGLFNEVSEDDIAKLLNETEQTVAAVDALVDTAVKAGGRDNVTVVLMDITGEDFADTPATVAAVDRGDIDTVPTVQDPANIQVADPTETLDPIPAVPERDEPASTKRRRWFGGRSLMLMMSVLVVLAVGVAGSSVYARAAYFADDVEGEVAILRGRPEGVLWFDPDVIENTELPVESLNGASKELLNNRTQWSSLDDAREFVSNLELVPVNSEPTDTNG